MSSPFYGFMRENILWALAVLIILAAIIVLVIMGIRSKNSAYQIVRFNREVLEMAIVGKQIGRNFERYNGFLLWEATYGENSPMRPAAYNHVIHNIDIIFSTIPDRLFYDQKILRNYEVIKQRLFLLEKNLPTPASPGAYIAVESNIRRLGLDISKAGNTFHAANITKTLSDINSRAQQDTILLGVVLVSLVSLTVMFLIVKINQFRRQNELLVHQRSELELLGSMLSAFVHITRDNLTAILLATKAIGQRYNKKPWDRHNILTLEMASSNMVQLTAEMHRAVSLGSFNESPQTMGKIIETVKNADLVMNDGCKLSWYLSLKATQFPVFSLSARFIVKELISNAISASPPGGQVNVSAKVANNHLIFRVQNGGEPINSKDMADILKPFVSVKRDPNVHTGMGLFAVKNIVTKQAGQLDIKSDRKAGTRVTIKLPVAGERNGDNAS